MHPSSPPHFFFFFNDTATTEIYTLSLHDALPIQPAATPRQTSWDAARARGSGLSPNPWLHRRAAPNWFSRSKARSQDRDGRVFVETRDRAAVRRVANPLGVGHMGETHFQFGADRPATQRPSTQRAAPACCPAG